MIEAKNLSKKYGTLSAVEHLNFQIEEGEIVGFLGLNGAGKSTTMNMLTGYLTASEGAVLIDGIDMEEEPNKAKKKIGYLPEVPPLYSDMTVQEYLNFIYELKGVKLPRKEHLKEIFKLTGIEAVKGRLIGNLSKGYRQRVGIAYALVGNPPILILDEPTAGLDPKQIVEIRRLIGKLGKDHTVMLSTHILQEVQSVCKRIMVLHNGKIVADGNAETLERNLLKEKGIAVQIDGPKEKVQNVLRQISGVIGVKILKKADQGVYEYFIETKEGMDVRKKLFEILSENKWPLMECRGSTCTLEELFMKLVCSDRSDFNN